MMMPTARNQIVKRHWRAYPVDPSCVLYLPFYQYGSEQPKIWDISGNNNHGTISGPIPGTYPMLQQVASGSVTQANMRISAVNGTAFVDFSAANVLTDYLNHLLVVKDSTGRVIQGYIKVAGEGETYLEVMEDIGFDDDAKWTKGTGWTVGGSKGVGILVPQYQGISQVKSILHTLYKASVTVSSFSQGGAKLYTSGLIRGTEITENKTQIDYLNAGGIICGCLGSTVIDSTLNIDDLSFLKVLTPSATGVTITSTKGGGTFNWDAKAPLFNYNDSSGYTYTIYEVPGYTGQGWFGDGIDDRFVHSSLNLGTAHTLHYWLLYRGLSGVIHGGAANYHGLRLTPTACGYNVGTTEVTVTHSAVQGQPVLFSIDRNGTSVTFYQNGVQIGNAQTLLANNNLTVTDFLRYSDGTSYWYGSLLEAMASNINKGAQEIRNYYELTRHRYA